MGAVTWIVFDADRRKPCYRKATDYRAFQWQVGVYVYFTMFQIISKLSAQGVTEERVIILYDDCFTITGWLTYFQIIVRKKLQEFNLKMITLASD